MGFSTLKIAIAGLLSVAIITIIGVGYSHYTGLLAEREILKANNMVLETAVETQQTTINAQTDAIGKWDEALKDFAERMDTLQKVQEEATGETRRLNALFSKHNLGKLATDKPGLIEPRLNAGSDRANRMLECATGSGSSDC